MAEEILTIFKADLSELEAAVAKGDKLIDGYTDSTLRASAAENQLGNAAGNASAKVSMLGAATSKTAVSETQLAVAGNKAAASQANLAVATERSGAKLNIFQRIAQGIRNTFTGLVNGVKGFGAGAKDAFAKATTGGTQAGGVIRNLSGSLTSAVGSAGGLGTAFAGLAGPIGIAAGAVVGFIANFSRLDSVKVGLDAISTAFDTIRDRLANLDFKGLFDPKTQAKDIAFAARTAQLTDAIEEAQLGVNKANAEAELQITGLNQKLRDKTKSEEERLAIAEQIGEIEAKRAAEEQAFLKIQVAAQKDINAQQLSALGEVSDANKAALNEREIALLKSQERTVQLTETTERRVNAIVEQGANERNAIEAKALAAREKAAADAAKKEEERLAKEKKIGELQDVIQSVQLQLEDEDFREGMSEVDIKVLDSQVKFQKLAATINDAFEKLKALQDASTQEGQAEIAVLEQGQAQALAPINEAASAEEAGIRAADAEAKLELAQETQDKINAIGEDGLQERIRQIRDEYRILLEENEMYIEDKLQQDQNRIDLEAERDAAIREARQEQNAIDAEAEAERNAEYIGILEDTTSQATALIAQAAAEGKLESEQFAKALVGIALDALEKILLMVVLQIIANSTAKGAETGGAPGAAVGLIAGIVIGAVIKGLFAVVKSQVAAAYTGDPYVQGKGGRDQIPYMLTQGERVVTRDKNKEHWEPLQAIHEGRFDKWLDKEFQGRTMDVPYELVQSNPLTPYLLNTDMQLMHSVNAYMEGDTGQRLSNAIMFPKYFDQNMVKSMERGNEEMKTNNKLLSMLVESTKKNQRHARSW